jgi:hypothetical protein
MAGHVRALDNPDLKCKLRKAVALYNSTPYHEDVWRSECIAPLILNLGTGWWVILPPPHLPFQQGIFSFRFPNLFAICIHTFRYNQQIVC